MRWWQISGRDADLERELRADLELEEEEQRERGLPSEESRFAARRALGNALLIREQTHEAWGWAPLERVWQDLRYALRQMKRSPGLASACLITLALGIGANTAMFSVVQGVILAPLPFPQANRLMFLWEKRLIKVALASPFSGTTRWESTSGADR